MKTLLQSLVALLVLVGGIGVFSYMSQYTRKPPAPKPSPGPVTATAAPGQVTKAVHVPAKVAQWDFFDESYAEAFETGSHGHYDFWFSNPNPVPIDVTMSQQGCTCSEVQVGFVPPDEVAKWHRHMGQYASLDAVSNLFGLPDLGAAVAAAAGLPAVTQWETFPQPRMGRRSFSVPGRSPEAGPQLGIIRLKWETKDAQPRRLTATIEYRVDQLLEDYAFEVPVRGVVPLMTSTGTLLVGELGYNEVRDIGFYCFSATRPNLSVKVDEASPDPCIEVSQPRPLSDQEMAELPDKVSLAGLRMKCAFHVGIKVYERRGDNQLDLGPLNKSFRVRAAPDAEQTVSLLGSVRSGSITLGEGADRGRIDLGNFRADRGVEKRILLSSPEPDMKLKVVGHTPEALKVTLTERESKSLPKRWDLTVEVDPRGLAGLLQNSSVILETVTPQPRKIRIPVTGNATY
jgi:hypothetical protein